MVRVLRVMEIVICRKIVILAALENFMMNDMISLVRGLRLIIYNMVSRPRALLPSTTLFCAPTHALLSLSIYHTSAMHSNQQRKPESKGHTINIPGPMEFPIELPNGNNSTHTS